MSLNSGETLQPFKALNQLIFDSSGNLIGIQNDRAVGNDLRIGGGSGVDGTFATLIATTALKLNSGATFDLYNTEDQTTNYERLRADWSGNVARIYTQAAGTGTVRGMSIATGTYAGTSGTTTALTVNPTINQSGTAGYTALDINPTETATGSGTKLLLRAAVANNEKFRVDNIGLAYANSFIAVTTTGIGWASGFGATTDLRLVRDNASELALRYGAAAQTFRIYNTYTDGSNYERANMYWAGNVFYIQPTGAGTGVGRHTVISNTATGSAIRWGTNLEFTTSLLASADNTYDIGASGANRPRNVYIGGSTVIGAFHTVGVSTVAALPAADRKSVV